jgi:hypothetical protein
MIQLIFVEPLFNFIPIIESTPYAIALRDSPCSSSIDSPSMLSQSWRGELPPFTLDRPCETDLAGSL